MCCAFFCVLFLPDQTNAGGDYYTGEYDYSTVDGSQPETPTEKEKGQVFFYNLMFGITMYLSSQYM